MQDYSYDEYEEYDEQNDEEVSIGTQGRMKVAAGVMDFLMLIVGLVVILLTVTLLVSLINWVISDLSRSFFVIQTQMK